jgi:hypothetical protein
MNITFKLWMLGLVLVVVVVYIGWFITDITYRQNWFWWCWSFVAVHSCTVFFQVASNI